MESEKVIWSLLNCLRGSAELFVAFELSLQILAWVKLSSETERLPSKLRLTESSVPTTTKKLLDIFKDLSNFDGLDANKSAFENLVPKRNTIPDESSNTALNTVLSALRSGRADLFDIPETVYFSIPEKAEQQVPEEVVEVMTYLAGDLRGKTVYCPYDTLCLIARRVVGQDGMVSVETPYLSPIPWLINILTDSKIHTSVSDPIRQPGFLDGQKLKKFDISIAFPPLGAKYEIDVIKNDWMLKRFKEQTSSGAVLSIRHIMSQTKEKSIIAVQNSILFSGGAELSLREDLLTSKQIEAVISMPPALLPFTAIPFSILILNNKRESSSVKFMDGGNEQFFTRDGRNRSQLVHWKKLLEAFDEDKDETIVKTVSIEEILANGAHLEVSQYVLSPEQRRVEEILSHSSLKILKEIVQFIRPIPKGHSHGKVEALEVGVADFPEYGYFLPPERKVLLPESVLHSKDDKTFLRKDDILISVKGNVGKIAITPASVPPSGKGGWVANQACLVLRVKSDSDIDPKVLFIYLQSEVGQTLIRRLVSGATTPLIQLQALQKLRVIVPDKEEAKKVTETFSKQIENQVHIEKLKHEQKILSKAHWKIETNEMGE